MALSRYIIFPWGGKLKICVHLYIENYFISLQVKHTCSDKSLRNYEVTDLLLLPFLQDFFF